VHIDFPSIAPSLILLPDVYILAGGRSSPGGCLSPGHKKEVSDLAAAADPWRMGLPLDTGAIHVIPHHLPAQPRIDYVEFNTSIAAAAISAEPRINASSLKSNFGW
jgi:hypothetical protein